MLLTVNDFVDKKIKKVKINFLKVKKYYAISFLSLIIFVFFYFSFGNIPFSSASNKEESIILNPSNCMGWNQPEKAQETNLLSTAETADFTEKNSAFYQAGTPDLNLEAPMADSADLICQQFAITDDIFENYKILNSQINISLGADSYENNEDVLSVYYSYDGEEWQTMESLSLVSNISNGTHGGWVYDLGEDFNKSKAENLKIKFTYYADDAREKIATAYVDGVSLKLTLEALSPPPDLSQNIVNLEKSDYQMDELPQADINVSDNSMLSFLGIGGDEREIESITLVNPQGENKDLPIPENTKNNRKHNVKELEITPGDFTIPGEYKLKVLVQQGGRDIELIERFSWGVLVMNPTKSMYHMGETVNLGMGVLDNQGHTICNADMQLEITAPTGEKQILSTQDNSVSRSNACGPITVTNLPDYSATFDIKHNGDYHLKLIATTEAGIHTIEEDLPVLDNIPFDISRITSSRIWPIADYEVFLEVVPAQDYSGLFRESMPTDFTLKRIDQDGQESMNNDRKIIDWFVEWKAGQAYTLSYQYDAPDRSPDIFLLGPAEAPEIFTEARQWQIASDAANGNGMLVYDEDMSNTLPNPHYRTWTPSDVSSESNMQAYDGGNGSDLRFVQVEAAPTRDEYMRVEQYETGNIQAQMFTGGSWSIGSGAATNGSLNGTGLNITYANYRNFDVAYEDSTGDALVVYEDSATANKTLKYRTWNGSTWSAEGTIDFSGVAESGTDDVSIWVELVPDYGSDNIMLIWKNYALYGIYGAVWNGSSWDDIVLHDAAGVPTSTKQSIDCAWEGTSGDGMAVWGTGTTTDYSTYIAGEWANGSGSKNPAGAVVWLQAAGSPNNNYIAMIHADVVSTSTADVGVDMWNGSDWTTVTTPTDDGDINNNGYAQAVDVEWEYGGSSDRALFAWRDGIRAAVASETALSYMVYDISANAFQAIDDGGTECAITEGDAGYAETVTSLDLAEDNGGPCLTSAYMVGNTSGVEITQDYSGRGLMVLTQNELTLDVRPEAMYWQGEDNATWLAQTGTMGAIETDASPGTLATAAIAIMPYSHAFKKYSADGTGLLAYHEDGANLVNPHYRTWTAGTDYSAEGDAGTGTVTGYEEATHKIIEACPTREEYISGSQTSLGHLDLQVWDGSTWIDGANAPTNGDFTTNIGGLTEYIENLMLRMKIHPETR